jgi:hypothetical protein
MESDPTLAILETVSEVDITLEGLVGFKKLDRIIIIWTGTVVYILLGRGSS